MLGFHGQEFFVGKKQKPNQTNVKWKKQLRLETQLSLEGQDEKLETSMLQSKSSLARTLSLSLFLTLLPSLHFLSTVRFILFTFI